MKGQDLFLAALKLLHSDGRDVHGLIVGGDAYELAPAYTAHLHRQIQQLQLQGHVTMTGHVPSAAPYIAALDVLVCASTSEPFGIVVLEAMGQGSQSYPLLRVGLQRSSATESPGSYCQSGLRKPWPTRSARYSEILGPVPLLGPLEGISSNSNLPPRRWQPAFETHFSTWRARRATLTWQDADHGSSYSPDTFLLMIYRRRESHTR